MWPFSGYSPGYRYDGLYSVEKFWDCQGKAGFKVFKFALRRLPDQDPPPWVYTNPNAQVGRLSSSPCLTLSSSCPIDQTSFNLA